MNAVMRTVLLPLRTAARLESRGGSEGNVLVALNIMQLLILHGGGFLHMTKKRRDYISFFFTDFLLPDVNPYGAPARFSKVMTTNQDDDSGISSSAQIVINCPPANPGVNFSSQLSYYFSSSRSLVTVSKSNRQLRQSQCECRRSTRSTRYVLRRYPWKLNSHEGVWRRPSVQGKKLF